MPGHAELLAISTIFTVMVVVTVIPYWKICTKAGFPGPLALLMLVPIANIILLFYLAFADWPSQMSCNMWQAIWAWVVCFAVTIAVSLVTRPKTDAELEGLVKGLTPKTEGAAVGLFGRPAFWAVVSAALVVGLNVYFW